MTIILECNSVSLKSCIPIPDFSAEHQQKTENWFSNGNKLDFSTKIFNKNNNAMHLVSFSAVSSLILLNDRVLISLPELNWISDRKSRDVLVEPAFSVPVFYVSC